VLLSLFTAKQSSQLVFALHLMFFQHLPKSPNKWFGEAAEVRGCLSIPGSVVVFAQMLVFFMYKYCDTYLKIL